MSKLLLASFMLALIHGVCAGILKVPTLPGAMLFVIGYASGACYVAHLNKKKAKVAA